MRGFIPEGYVGLEDAALRLAKALKPDLWAAIPAREHDAMWSAYGRTHGLTQLELWADRIPPEACAGFTERYASLNEAFSLLRGALHSGRLPSHVVVGGRLAENTDRDVWSDDDAVLWIFDDGRIAVAGGIWPDRASIYESLNERVPVAIAELDLAREFPALCGEGATLPSSIPPGPPIHGSAGADEKVNVAAPSASRGRGRPPAVAWDMVKAEAERLMAHHGPFSHDDPHWNAQARLEEELHEYIRAKLKTTVGATQLRARLRAWRLANPSEFPTD